jgi:hypothetical protein
MLQSSVMPTLVHTLSVHFATSALPLLPLWFRAQFSALNVDKEKAISGLQLMVVSNILVDLGKLNLVILCISIMTGVHCLRK